MYFTQKHKSQRTNCWEKVHKATVSSKKLDVEGTQKLRDGRSLVEPSGHIKLRNGQSLAEPSGCVKLRNGLSLVEPSRRVMLVRWGEAKSVSK